MRTDNRHNSVAHRAGWLEDCAACRIDATGSASGVPTENARLYAREFAAEQLRQAAKWAEANGYDDAAVDHLIRKATELWP